MDMSFWIFNEFMNMFYNFVYENFVDHFFFFSVVGLLHDKNYISLPS
jgi:hypothetical protein